MKKLFKVAITAMLFVLAGSLAKAQGKVGHINFQALVGQMPEAKTIKTQLDTYQKQFIDQLQTMNTELQTKGKAFQSQSATMTDAVRTAKETELQDIQKRMQDYQNNAQQQVDAKTAELSKPLIDKARGVVAAVAKEKGYTYVIDSSTTAMVVAPEGDDMMAAAKAKLGIK